jgi:hypothetical protein
MAKILAFHPGEMRRDASALASDGASAEVIVFPGVRYERWDDAENAHSQLQSGKKRGRDRRRDVLELAE